MSSCVRASQNSAKQPNTPHEPRPRASARLHVYTLAAGVLRFRAAATSCCIAAKKSKRAQNGGRGLAYNSQCSEPFGDVVLRPRVAKFSKATRHARVPVCTCILLQRASLRFHAPVIACRDFQKGCPACRRSSARLLLPLLSSPSLEMRRGQSAWASPVHGCLRVGCWLSG